MIGSRAASLPLSAALIVALGSAAQALQAGAPAPVAPDLAAAAAAGPVSTAAYGARCIGAAYDDTSAFQAAIDTGHTVYAPAMGGRCHITRPLVMKVPGQIFGGDGRARTKLVIEPGFAGQGVFVARTGEPGPVWRDFSVSFVQPDTDDRAKLTRYPPAFDARSTPRFEMDHLGCYLATTCVDMKGNSGGSTIADLQMSAFEVGIDIDGSLDTVRITDPHWWPFMLSKGLQKIFLDQGLNRSTALNIGRMDDLVLRGGLFLGGLALHSFGGSTGPAFGTIEGVDFDSTSGIEIDAGNLQISSCIFTLADPRASAMLIRGGAITLTSSRISTGIATSSAAIIVERGDLTITATSFDTSSFDMTLIKEAHGSGVLTLVGNRFTRSPNLTFQKPTLLFEGGRTVAQANFASDKGKGSGFFMLVQNDNPSNRIIGNSSPGWSHLDFLSRKGVYLFN